MKIATQWSRESPLLDVCSGSPSSRTLLDGALAALFCLFWSLAAAFADEPNTVLRAPYLVERYSGGREVEDREASIWRADIGSMSGTPAVHCGRVLIGTNNWKPRDPRIQGDRGVLMCFDAASGEFLWRNTLAE